MNIYINLVLFVLINAFTFIYVSRSSYDFNDIKRRMKNGIKRAGSYLHDNHIVVTFALLIGSACYLCTVKEKPHFTDLLLGISLLIVSGSTYVQAVKLRSVYELTRNNSHSLETLEIVNVISYGVAGTRILIEAPTHLWTLFGVICVTGLAAWFILLTLVRSLDDDLYDGLNHRNLEYWVYVVKSIPKALRRLKG